MEQEPIVLSEIFWGKILPRIIKQHQFRHDNQEPSKIQVVMIEEIGGIEVEFIAQVKEVPKFCFICQEPIDMEELGSKAKELEDKVLVHTACVEDADDSNRPLGTGGHSEPDLPSSANSLGESEPERSE